MRRLRYARWPLCTEARATRTPLYVNKSERKDVLGNEKDIQWIRERSGEGEREEVGRRKKSRKKRRETRMDKKEERVIWKAMGKEAAKTEEGETNNA